MNANKKPTVARGIPQPFNRQAGSVGQFKPVVAQLKTRVPPQSIKRPVAPPVYRPQPLPKVLQTKTSSSPRPHVGQAPQRPAAPPVYSPQTKKIGQPQAISPQRKSPTAPLQNRPASTAPAAYRPPGCPSRFPIQRKRWRFDGEEWIEVASSKEDKNKFPLKKKVFAHKPEEGDYYDEETGEHHRASVIRLRLERARERQARREKAKKRGQVHVKHDFEGITKKNKNRLIFQTPGGAMRFGQGPYSYQPFGNLDEEDWGEEKRLAVNYDAISTALDKSKHFNRVMGVIDVFMSSVGDVEVREAKLTREDKMALTALSALLSVAEPHQLRNPLGGKPERAAVRHAKKLGSASPVFNRRAGAYVPSWSDKHGADLGGTEAWRQMIRGVRILPYDTLVMLEEDLSESSNDENEGMQLRSGKRKAEEDNQKKEKKEKNK